ncbi:MAG: putative sulfate exporter family transporter, partial [Candidatus Bathyarchaeia archaeon]
VWLGFLILALASMRVVTWLPKTGAWGVDPSTAFQAGNMPSFVLLGYFILLGLGLLALTSVAVLSMKEKIKPYWAAFPVTFFLAFLSLFLANQATIRTWGLEYVLWALVFGLLISNTVGTPKWLKPAVKTELFVKIGLVLLGAETLFNDILSAGAFGMAQAVVVVLLVWYFCYFLAVKAGLKKSFASVLASGVSICGVSAAIAAGGAIKADRKEVSYAISLVLLLAMPMLVGLPILAKAVGMVDAVAGAWIGGTIDTTPAVVAAGALYSSKAMSVASIIKMSQNALIGVAAFLLSLYWVLRVDRNPGGPGGERPRLEEIWYRFPKFIVGFIIASVVFSLLLVPTMGYKPVQAVLDITKSVRGWFFAMAFIGIGLDTKLSELVKAGRGKPFAVFLAAQTFNILLTLVLAYALFGGLFFPAPI